MSYGINRDKALALVNTYIKNSNLVKHCLATEAVMARLAEHFKADKECWSLAGLLHDLDVELIDADLTKHGGETARILKEHGVAQEIIDVIIMHNETYANQKRATQFHYALAAGETITGLITATTLVYPDKKLASVKAQSVVKRMKEKAFAASVNRDTIMECEKIGLPLPQFAEICIDAMRSISQELGL